LKELDLLIKELDELHDGVRINVVSADNDALSAQ